MLICDFVIVESGVQLNLAVGHGLRYEIAEGNSLRKISDKSAVVQRHIEGVKTCTINIEIVLLEIRDHSLHPAWKRQCF